MLVGLGSLLAGLYLWSLPLALIVGGLLFILIGLRVPASTKE